MSSITQVLALDGGGFRGLSQAIVLAEMEKRTGRRTADCFDVIAGTSTGGILALALGKGLPAQKIVDFYIEDGKSIFPSSRTARLIRWAKWWITAKHSACRLEKALKKCLGEECILGDSNTRLVIPSFELGVRKPYLFKTDHKETFEFDWSRRMWEIAMATSAAPTYFPYFKSSWGICYADGGLWANNPSIVGAAEAIKILEQPPESLRILNLGNGCSELALGKPSWLKKHGVVGWAKDIPELLMDASAVSVASTATYLWDNKFLRIEPKLSNRICPLDHYEPNALRAHAEEAVRINLSKLRPFYEHNATPYTKKRRPFPKN